MSVIHLSEAIQKITDQMSFRTDVQILFGVDLCSIKVIPDSHVSDWKTVERSWRERLFTRPWRPLQKFKKEKSTTLLMTDRNELICSYETYNWLKERSGLDL